MGVKFNFYLTHDCKNKLKRSPLLEETPITYVHPYLHTYLLNYLLTYLHTYILTCIHAYIHTTKFKYIQIKKTSKENSQLQRKQFLQNFLCLDFFICVWILFICLIFFLDKVLCRFCFSWFRFCSPKFIF